MSKANPPLNMFLVDVDWKTGEVKIRYEAGVMSTRGMYHPRGYSGMYPSEAQKHQVLRHALLGAQSTAEANLRNLAMEVDHAQAMVEKINLLLAQHESDKTGFYSFYTDVQYEIEEKLENAKDHFRIAESMVKVLQVLLQE